MGLKGIYTALSGAMAHSQKLDTIANNIANVNSPSFKRDQQVFREYLTANEKQMDVIEVPRVPATIESFYQTRGGERGFVENAGSYTDFSQGHVKETGNALDVALRGNGLFEVLTPQGVMYTRNGSFRLDGQGTLVNSQGHAVLQSSDPGVAPETRKIQLSQQPVQIDKNGMLYQNGQAISQLSVIQVGNTDALEKYGDSMFQFREGFDPSISLNGEYEVQQGFLEQSNVNIVSEMTDMINTTRTFEATQKAIKAYDQMNDKLVNEVPRLG